MQNDRYDNQINDVIQQINGCYYSQVSNDSLFTY